MRGVWAAAALAFFGGALWTWDLSAAPVETMIVQGLAAFTLVATAGSIVCRVLLNATAGRAAKPASQVGLNAAGIDLTLPPVEVPSAGAAEGEPVAEVSRSDES